MRHLRTCTPGRQRRTARIGEEVEHARFPAQPGFQLRNAVINEIPILTLFREYAHMLERSEAQPHPQGHAAVTIVDSPLLRHSRPQQPPAALLAVGIAPENGGRHTFPLLFRQGLVPDGLRFGAHRHITPETLQLLEAAAIDQLIILPLGGQYLRNIRTFHKTFDSIHFNTTENTEKNSVPEPPVNRVPRKRRSSYTAHSRTPDDRRTARGEATAEQALHPAALSDTCRVRAAHRTASA